MRGAVLSGMVAAVIVGAAVFTAPATAQGLAPAFTLIHGGPLTTPAVLDAEESHTFQFGTVVEEIPADLEMRPSIEFALFWFEPWLTFVRDGGDLGSVSPSESNQQARLYFGTESDPPILAFQNRNPAGWPALESEFHRFIGPLALEILADHGVPVELSDPFQRSILVDDPPPLTSEERDMLLLVMPNGGSGGLADTSRDVSADWLRLAVPAMAAMLVVVAGVTIHRRGNQSP